MTLKNALSEENLTETVTEIQTNLPERKDSEPTSWVCNELTDKFWRKITGQSDPPEDYVFYNQLSIETPLIGQLVTGSDENGPQLPWWLRSFEWTFEMIGRETLELPQDKDEIDRVKDFDPSETRVYKPELTFDDNGSSFKKLLTGLVALKDEIINSAAIEGAERTVYEGARGHPALPTDVFTLAGDAPIRTTDEFETWLESLLELCPPYHETTMALTWYNTGLSLRLMESMLEEDVDHLNRAGLVIDQDRVWNNSYREAIAKIMGFRGVFDWELQIGSQYQQPMANNLEAEYIQQWLSNTEPLSERQAKAIRLAANENKTSDDLHNETEYAPCCIELPISYHRARYALLTFDTQRQKKHGGLYANYVHRAKAIKQAIEQANLFPESDR